MATSIDKARNRIAFIVVGGWMGVPALVVLAVLFGIIQSQDVRELEFFQLWHDFYTPVATLVLGFYFGLPNSQ